MTYSKEKELKLLNDFTEAVKLRIINNNESFADAVGNVTYIAAGHTDIPLTTHDDWYNEWHPLDEQKQDSNIQL